MPENGMKQLGGLRVRAWAGGGHEPLQAGLLWFHVPSMVQRMVGDAAGSMT